MTDSYCAVGDTPEEARLAMGEYLIDIYGLVKVMEAKEGKALPIGYWRKQEIIRTYRGGR